MMHGTMSLKFICKSHLRVCVGLWALKAVVYTHTHTHTPTPTHTHTHTLFRRSQMIIPDPALYLQNIHHNFYEKLPTI